MYGDHSSNDAILKYVYRTVQGGQTAAGLAGFTHVSGKLVNVDVSDQVKSHCDYQDNVSSCDDGATAATRWTLDRQ